MGEPQAPIATAKRAIYFFNAGLDELDTPKGGRAQKAGGTHAVSGIHAVQTQHPAVEAKAKLLGYILTAILRREVGFKK